MTSFVVSPRADADIETLLEHLAEMAGPTVARRYALELDVTFERPTMFPASGARRKSLGPYSRIAVVSPYVIVYDHHDGEVVIVRVLDGCRNATRRVVRQ